MSDEEPKRGGQAPPEEDRATATRPRTWLVSVILLSVRKGDSYGYELIGRAAAFGFGPINSGTLYRTLRRMEQEDLVRSSWETSEGGPARRMYSITDAGEAYLGFWAKALEQYQRNMDTFFELYGGAPTRTDETGDD